VVLKGSGRMPGFRRLPEKELDALMRFLMSGEIVQVDSKTAGTQSPNDLKYSTDGYNKFLDPDGYPAVAPPWGTLNAISLNTGDYAWKIPFGEIPASGLKNTGSENYGGGIVTAGGVLFIGATNHDRKMHVYDKKTGKLLWEYVMDAAGNATPVVYEWKGRQYCVIAAGGGKSGAVSGGNYYAFALPPAVP
jgi:quinoprotein glucose dehydrogenase